MMSHSNNCCVVYEPAICEYLDFHVAIFYLWFFLKSRIFLAVGGGGVGAPQNPLLPGVPEGVIRSKEVA